MKAALREFAEMIFLAVVLVVSLTVKSTATILEAVGNIFYTYFQRVAGRHDARFAKGQVRAPATVFDLAGDKECN